MGRRQRTEQEVTDIRDRICDVALSLAAKKGAEAVTIRSIAADVGCSPMTPYLYFPGGKREILVAARVLALYRLGDKLEACVAEEGRNVHEQFELLGKAYAEFALDHAESFRIIFESGPLKDDEFPELEAAVDRMRKPVNQMVLKGVQEGVFGGDPGAVMHIFWSGLHGLVTLHQLGQLQYGRSIEELVPLLIDTIKKGSFE